MSYAPVRAQIVTTMSLYQVAERSALVEIVKSHPECAYEDLVHVVLDMLIDEGSLTQERVGPSAAIIRYVERYVEREPIWPLAAQLAAAEEYRRAHCWWRHPLKWAGVKV